jgi:hypothetical protein
MSRLYRELSLSQSESAVFGILPGLTGLSNNGPSVVIGLGIFLQFTLTKFAKFELEDSL